MSPDAAVKTLTERIVQGLVHSQAYPRSRGDHEKPLLDQSLQYDAARFDRVRTRIGDDRISVALDRPVRGWYDRGALANDVFLPFDQLHRAGVTDFADPLATFEADIGRGPIYRVGETLRVRYGPEGWIEVED